MSIASKTRQTIDKPRKTAYNSGFKKLAVKWLNEAL